MPLYLIDNQILQFAINLFSLSLWDIIVIVNFIASEMTFSETIISFRYDQVASILLFRIVKHLARLCLLGQRKYGDLFLRM